MQTRRGFLRRTAPGGTGFLLLKNSRLAFAYEANSKLNIAGVGVGGQGRSNLDQFAALGQNLVALCDVDATRAGDVFQKFPEAKAFEDFRRMYDSMDREIDAVVVSTPDHTHAVAAVAAMRRGKHVFCEKPLTRTVYEARIMRETALATGVITQMGNQGSADSRLRRAIELIQGGVLGTVHEAHVWFDGGNEPHALPEDYPPIPSGLKWDLWLGPASFRPFHPSYLPGTWRGWRPFGSGIVGDFGCHTGNIMFRSLRLQDLWTADATSPNSIIRFQAWPSEVTNEGYPSSLRVLFEIPARGQLPPLQLSFYAKERPHADLMLGYPPGGWGDLIVGEDASLYSDCPWNTRFILLPEDRYDGFKGGPPETLPRSNGHHREWVEACLGIGKTFSPFEIGGPLTEILQLANLATLVEGPLEYSIQDGRIRNSPQANALLHREYRPGWTLV